MAPEANAAAVAAELVIANPAGPSAQVAATIVTTGSGFLITLLITFKVLSIA
jgi:hypothetical protein